MPHFEIHIPKKFGLDKAVKYIKDRGLKVFLGGVKKVRETKDGQHFYFPQKRFPR